VDLLIDRRFLLKLTLKLGDTPFQGRVFLDERRQLRRHMVNGRVSKA
jgi:hypothetical protein